MYATVLVYTQEHLNVCYRPCIYTGTFESMLPAPYIVTQEHLNVCYRPCIYTGTFKCMLPSLYIVTHLNLWY